eukprot:5482163-Prymnesium_polylepis.1
MGRGARIVTAGGSAEHGHGARPPRAGLNREAPLDAGRDAGWPGLASGVYWSEPGVTVRLTSHLFRHV